MTRSCLAAAATTVVAVAVVTIAVAAVVAADGARVAAKFTTTFTQPKKGLLNDTYAASAIGACCIFLREMTESGVK